MMKDKDRSSGHARFGGEVVIFVKHVLRAVQGTVIVGEACGVVWNHRLPVTVREPEINPA